MSAIWGIIDLEDNPVKRQVVEQMSLPYESCKIDRTEQLKDGSVYMACGLQYFTPEAYNEKMPLYDETHNRFIVADVVLDNREEICSLLGIENGSNLPDGYILNRYHHLYGSDGLDKLAGAFAFVVYDASTRKIELVIDAVGNRCLYYCIIGSSLYFSTLIEPLKSILKDVTVNERWLADFLAMESMYMFSDLESTPVEGIFRVAPAQRVIFSEKGIEKETYWKPLERIDIVKGDTDEAYCAGFRKVFSEAVSCVIRDKSKVGILLSGGLDSTAVASLAAGVVGEEGGIMHAYTSVPEEDYIPPEGTKRVTDEGDIAFQTVQTLGHSDATRINMPGVNPWDEHKRIMNYLEMPYKSYYNVLWLHDAMEQALTKDIRIILTGAYGNSSISFTNLPMFFSDMLRRGKWVSFIKEMNLFHRSMGISRKLILRDTLKTNLKKKEPYIGDRLEGSFMYEEFYKRQDTESRLGAMYATMDTAALDYQSFRQMLWHPRSFRQIGEMETKRSLATGVLMRDPTKDKRVIEYCMSLPLEVFASEGIERRLINVYMADVIPSHVIKIAGGGQQGADFLHRMTKVWPRIKEEWIRIYERYSQQPYVDTAKAIKDLEAIDIGHCNNFKLMRHMYYLTTLEYIHEFIGEL